MKRNQVIMALIFALAAGCVTTKTEKAIDQDISQQTATTPAQAEESGRDAIINSTNLTQEQKEKMLTMMDRAHAELASIRKNESQVRSSLVKYLASGQYEIREISTYRKKLQKIENKRLDLIFSNLKESRKILGKESLHNPNLIDLDRYNGERL